MIGVHRGRWRSPGERYPAVPRVRRRQEAPGNGSIEAGRGRTPVRILPEPVMYVSGFE